jgi:hypothetical protein
VENLFAKDLVTISFHHYDFLLYSYG